MAEVAVNVIVPLGGLGSRFQKEGYLTRPKPFVPVLGKPMILWVLENLSLGKEDKLVIVYNPSFMSIGNFMKEVVCDQYPDCTLVELPGPTRGAAETVLIGLNGLDEDSRKRPTMLVDGDTFYTADIVSQFRAVAAGHNAVFCFHDTQEKPIYSYITLDAEDGITEVKEKVKISDWANSGCYCFRSGAQLAAECEALIESNSKQESQDGVGEFYTSGVIAAMMAKKEPFRALKLEVSDIHVLGTPAQVQQFCETWPTQARQRFVFDLEGVLIAGFKGEPIARNVELCRRLKKQGHIIIVQSTRACGMERKTWAFLEELKIPCDDLRLGKPRAEHYISGPTTSDAVFGDLDKQLGFHPTEVRAAPRPRLAPKREAKVRKPMMHTVGKLRPTSKGVTCLVKVAEEPKEVEATLSSGKVLKFWEAVVGDDTGRVVLSMTEAQREGVVKDKVVVVRNAFVKMVQSHIRLAVDKWGKIDLDTEETVDKVGETNVSSTEYELLRA